MCYNHRYKGEFTTTLGEIMGAGKKSFKFLDLQKGVDLQTSLNLLSAKKEVQYSFMDFLQGGLQIGLMVGIDFTASNGNPNAPNSLHFINKQNPHNLNMYQQAILAIGSILMNYDSDQMVFFRNIRFLRMGLEQL